jgi:hypothetical protein
MSNKSEKSPDKSAKKEKREELSKKGGIELLEEEAEDFETTELGDYEMADMQAIREIVMLDPNDIEFRQRHAEDTDTDIAA